MGSVQDNPSFQSKASFDKDDELISKTRCNATVLAICWATASTVKIKVLITIFRIVPDRVKVSEHSKTTSNG